jgi:branched-subunit amino acid aminotransferase/4-amino-4-deoxychorismate lyase
MLKYPAWKNGKYCKLEDLTISILDLGLIHCDATYDVIAVKNGEIQNLQAHLHRFISSSIGWRIPVEYSDEDIEIVMQTLVAQAPTDNLLIWVGLTRGIPSSGNPRDLKNCKSNLFMYVKPYYGFNANNSATVCLAKSVRRVPNICIDQTNKNFAWNDLNKAQWEAIDRGYDTAILTCPKGYITEGPGFSVGFVSHDGFVYTPNTNCLEGTVINQVADICVKNGKQIFFTNFTPLDVYNEAAAMFLTSTAGNIIPVTKFENMVFEENETLKWLQTNLQ